MTMQSVSTSYFPIESSLSKLRKSHLPAVFVAVAGTVATGADAESVHHKSFLNSQAVASSQALTSGFSQDVQMTSASEPEVSGGFPVWLDESFVRIEKLGSLPDGWAGDGYVAAQETASFDAERLLVKLIRAGLKVKPAIGLDDDGTYSFHIADGKLIADLSVYADGTYSYFAEIPGHEVFSDESPIDGAIDHGLAELLKV
ncbi:MAG: hypothetical protein ABJL67_12575 [Sulfitobacter sp.]